MIAALGAGAAYATRESTRAGRDALATLRAAVAAERAVETSIASWDRTRNLLAVGASDSAIAGGEPAATVRAIRLDATRLLVEGVARARGAAPGVAGIAERAVSRVVRLAPPLPNARAAVTTGGALQLLDGASIDGADVPPTGWTDCPSPASDTAAVAVVDSALLRVAAGAVVRGGVRVSGAAADLATYARFGAEAWASLAARADVVVGAGVRSPNPAAGGACVVGADSWGEPARGAGGVAACERAFPVVLANGTLTLRGPARAQGTLLVDGDLVIDGSVTFAGVVVVRGAVRADAGALQLRGALLVASGASALGPGSRVAFSRCAVARAADVAALISVDRRRSWSEVTR